MAMKMTKETRTQNSAVCNIRLSSDLQRRIDGGFDIFRIRLVAEKLRNDIGSRTDRDRADIGERLLLGVGDLLLRLGQTPGEVGLDGLLLRVGLGLHLVARFPGDLMSLRPRISERSL